MMRAWYAYHALMGLDENCGRYIERYSAVQAKSLNMTPGQGGMSASASSVSAGVGTPGSTVTDGKMPGSGIRGGNAASDKVGFSLAAAIEKGLKEDAHTITAELAQTKAPLDIINEELIPALNRVGDGFEKGTVFLPQLLMSAEAAKSAFAVLKEQMDKSGEVQEKKGTVVIATVKGDIHDIGKNIVKVLLENYSFDVIDLGKDVPPEKIVDTVIRKDVRLVGLSALMTTTVVSMEETIKLLREKAPRCKVMVGGAVLNQEYADMIGADFYGKDAMQSVHYAQSIF